MENNFNENTPPKEIITSIILEITEIMKGNGFKYVKSDSKIIKRTKNFIFCVSFQSNRYNQRGISTECWIHCSVTDRNEKRAFWSKTLATSNSKQDQFHSWEFYDNEKYKSSLSSIKEIISSNLLPFFNRFEKDIDNLTFDVSENGFCVFNELQVYDMGYTIPLFFLEKYGTKEQIKIMFQNYVDRHELRYTIYNLQKAIEFIKKGKEPDKNGSQFYAKYIVKNGIELTFE